jgi:hypothetical protein
VLPVTREHSEEDTALDGIGDYFDVKPVKPVENSQDTHDDVAAWASLVDADLAMSESQRAALEFQHFAERFHAFATASIEQPSVCQAPPVDSSLRKQRP